MGRENSPHETLPFTDELQLLIDRLADDFKAALGSETLRIEDFLARVPALARRRLFRELFAAQIHRQQGQPDKIHENEYLSQYPEFAEDIRDVLARCGPQSPIPTVRISSELANQSVRPSSATDVADVHQTVFDDRTIEFPDTARGQAHNTPGAITFPRAFAQYDLIEEIARGGMGVVYRARQRGLDRMVALKMILSGQLASAEEIDRFYVEAEAAANLDHQYIVPIYEVGEYQGARFYSMAYVQGQSLSRRLVDDGPFPPRQAAELAVKIADAIAYAHAQGVIHRDLKPQNVMLDRSGQPRITDFGLAKRAEGRSEITSTGQILGTPSYMPPEQARGDLQSIGPLSDVYSLGALLYCTLTGRPPFQAATALETMNQVIEREPVRPRLLNPSISPDLDTICVKCLEKEPGQRYVSATALGEDLRRYLSGHPIIARPISRPSRVARWCHRNPVASALILSSLAAIVLLGASVNYRHRAQQARALANEKEHAAKVAEQLAATKDRVAKTAQELADTQEYYSRMNKARVEILGRIPGWSWRAWSEIDQLRTKDVPARNSVDLRSLTAACLSAVDLRPMHDIEFGYTVGTVAFSPDGSQLAIGELKGFPQTHLKLFDVATRACTAQWQFGTWSNLTRFAMDRFQEGFRFLKFSPNGRWLVAGTRHGYIYCFALPGSSSSPPHIWRAHKSHMGGLTFSPDSQLLYSTGHQEPLKCWQVNAGWKEVALTDPPGAQSVAVSSDGRWMYIDRGRQKLLNAATMTPHFNEPNLPEGYATFSADSRLLAINDNATLRLIELAHGNTVQVCESDGEKLGEQVQFAAGDSLLVAAASDGRIRLWDTASCQLVSWIDVPGVDSPRFSIATDGGMLAVTENQTVRLHEVRQPHLWRQAIRPAAIVQSFDIDRSNRRLFTAARCSHNDRTFEETVERWDLQDGRSDRAWTTTNITTGFGVEQLPMRIGCAPSGNQIMVSGGFHPPMWLPMDGQPLQFASSRNETHWKFHQQDALRSTDGRPLRVVDDPRALDGKAVLMGADSIKELSFPMSVEHFPNGHSFAVLASLSVDASPSGLAAIDKGVYFKNEKPVVLVTFPLDVARHREYQLQFIDVVTKEQCSEPGLYRPMLRLKDEHSTVLIDCFAVVSIDTLHRIGRESASIQYSSNGSLCWALLDRERVVGWQGRDPLPRFEWDIRTEEIITGDKVLSVLDASGDRVFVGSRAGELYALQATENGIKVTKRWRGPGGSISAIRSSASGRILVVGTVGGNVQTYTADAENDYQLSRHQKAIVALDVSPHEDWLAVGSDDGAIRVYGIADGMINEFLTLSDLPGPIQQLRFGADNNLLFALLRGESAVRVLDLAGLRREFKALQVAEGFD